MDYMYQKSEDPNFFPPHTVWCWWDYVGEFLDCTDDEEQANDWANTMGSVAEYQLVSHRKVVA